MALKTNELKFVSEARSSETMHRVTPFNVSCVHFLHRFTLNGEEPVVSS